MNERKPILEKGYRLTLPIPLFLCVLRALKQKDGLDSIPLISFEEIITKIFGKRYIFYNWEVGRQYLLLNKEIEIFSSCVKQDNSYQLIKLIKITEEGLFLIENGEPDKDYESEIEKAVNWVKLNLKP